MSFKANENIEIIGITPGALSFNQNIDFNSVFKMNNFEIEFIDELDYVADSGIGFWSNYNSISNFDVRLNKNIIFSYSKIINNTNVEVDVEYFKSVFKALCVNEIEIDGVIIKIVNDKIAKKYNLNDLDTPSLHDVLEISQDDYIRLNELVLEKTMPINEAPAKITKF